MARPTTREGWLAMFAELRAIRQIRIAERKAEKLARQARGEPEPERKPKYKGEQYIPPKKVWALMAELTGGTQAEARMWHDAYCAILHNEVINLRSVKIPTVGVINVHKKGPRKFWEVRKRELYTCDAEIKVGFITEPDIRTKHQAYTNKRPLEEKKEVAIEDLC